jgi:glycosyltransferase involved in cell wall biosynthesis
MNKIILSHPTGNANVRAVISALNDLGMLAKFNTTIASNQFNSLLKFLPNGLQQELRRRYYPVDRNLINAYPLREAARLIMPRLGLRSITKHEIGWACVDSVYTNLDINVAKRLPSFVEKYGVNAVYAYEDGALESFKKAKSLGLLCVYDLPIAYWETGRQLMLEEAERMPRWAKTLGGGIKDSDAKLERKVRELELADVIVGPGHFVMNSLPSWSKNKKIVMAPFGSPENKSENKPKEYNNSAERPLRVLFVGSMGQRKGLGDLLSAMKLLNTKSVELVVMGSLLAPLAFYKEEFGDFIYEPPRPHSEVLKLMASCDVFCLPSIVEGRALVMQEAMTQGLPIIITRNTGGEDLVKDGETGFIVPIRSPEIIAEKIQWFLDHKDKIPEMGISARNHAESYTWANYGNKVVQSIFN